MPCSTSTAIQSPNQIFLCYSRPTPFIHSFLIWLNLNFYFQALMKIKRAQKQSHCWEAADWRRGKNKMFILLQTFNIQVSTAQTKNSYKDSLLFFFNFVHLLFCCFARGKFAKNSLAKTMLCCSEHRKLCSIELEMVFIYYLFQYISGCTFFTIKIKHFPCRKSCNTYTFVPVIYNSSQCV